MSVPSKSKMRARVPCRSGRPLGRQVAGGELLPVVLGEQRLGIERIDLGRAAVEVDVDQVLCFAGKVALVIAPKKQAEVYCLGLQRRGLPVTIEPHDVHR